MSPTDTIVSAAKQYPRAMAITVYGIPASMLGAILWFMSQGILAKEHIGQNKQMIQVHERLISEQSQRMINADQERAAFAIEFKHLQKDLSAFMSEQKRVNEILLKSANKGNLNE